MGTFINEIIGQNTYLKTLCNGVRRPNNHVTLSKGIITTHALMPSLKDDNSLRYGILIGSISNIV